MKCLEDLDFFCVDNLPPALMPKFAELCRSSSHHRLALGMDVRGRSFFPDFKDALNQLPALGFVPRVFFFEASEAVLVRRYSETRRRHPLGGAGGIVQAIQDEARELAELRKQDTTLRLVDVRSRAEFEAVHIEGSILLSQPVMQQIMAEGTNMRPLVVVDHQGKNGLDAAAYFMGHGLQNVRCLRGGIDAFLSFVEEHRDAWKALFRDAGDPEVAEAIAGVQQQAVGVIAALMASDPDVRDNTEGDPGARALALEAYAQLLAGAIQALGNWWHDHQHVSREAVLDRAMEFCWLGMSQVSEGVRLTRRSPRAA